MNQPWLRDSNKTASGKPGAVHTCFEGDVTGIHTAKQGEAPRQMSGGRGGFPRLHGFGSEHAERATGDQVGLEREGIVNGGMSREEAIASLKNQ